MNVEVLLRLIHDLQLRVMQLEGALQEAQKPKEEE